jgi:hypothetical protein
MSTPKVIRAAQNLLRQSNRITHQLTKGLVSWLLRGLLVLGRQPRLSRAGFVLPTTVLLLLVVVLTVGAIGYRTFTRTQQAVTDRQQQVVYNAATPVIDRAKSKIEFLFDPKKDTRGGGVPSQTQLLGMMLNNERDLGGVTVPHFPDDKSIDPYSFDGETRIDVNGDGQVDNAWRYRVDLNGDGDLNSPNNQDGWAVYSIIFTAPQDGTALRDARNDPNNANVGWQKRAKALEVRNAPLSNAQQSNLICERDNGSSDATPLINGEGWFPDQINTTKIRKNFQVSAYVVPDNPNGTVATLEFQQDREATRGFKWAAWFRNDLEIFPGPAFNWNGAMHTEGSLFVGGDQFRGFLVSSPQSCIKSRDASEITAKENEKDQPIAGTPEFKGRFVIGTIRDNNFNGKATFDLDAGEGKPAPTAMDSKNDSVAPAGLKPLDFSLEPVTLQTKGQSEARNPIVKPAVYEDAAWKNTQFNKDGSGRLYAIKEMVTPYLDDTFRADNRWGPKPTWGQKGLPIGITSEDNAGGTSTAKIGEPITGVLELTGSDPEPGKDSASVGLDGYWERRARIDGLRLIVGQRLELGDPAGWGGPGSALPNSIKVENEPLRPWAGCSSAGDIRCNEERQRRNLWDNLAAVQATAVYHNATDTTPETRDFPDACLVTTIHPGTPTTLDRSSTFENLAYGLPATAIPGYTDQPNPLVISDFFRGRGTNGWEYSTPTAAAFSNLNSPLMRSLRNLAFFAGDPNGGTPSFKPFQDRTVHPYPSMAMWGDFSNLRQVFKLLDGGTSYDRLSPADKTTLHTAACTLGMLAYNLDYLEKLKVYDPTPTSDPTKIDTALRPLAGYTDTEIAPTGITLNNTVLADPRYSAGLRGRIRVIEHISRGYINATNAVNIPIDQRPPANFITSLRDINKNTGMDLTVWDPKKSNNPEAYVRLLERWRDDAGTSAAQKEDLSRIIALAQLIVTKEQVARDRTWGFKGTYSGTTYSEEGFVSTWPLGDCGFKIDDAQKSPGGWLLEPPSPAFNATVLATGTTETLASLPTALQQPDPLSRLCSSRPRYPALYSLFPAKINAITPAADIATAYAGGATGFTSHEDIADPLEEERARDAQDSLPRFGRYIINENAGATYEVVRPADVALRPLTLSQGVTLGGTRNWLLPYEAGTPSVGATPNSNRFNLIKVCAGRCSEPNNVATTFQLPKNGTLVRVAFKDSAFYNGREMMPIRALNLDLDLMRRSAHKDDLWLPKKGIIYAFREDAVSESHIVRPNGGNAWTACDTDAELRSTNCAIKTADVSAYDSKDPPVNDENFITPKPVDYYPDPDRRPNGFRLLQGANLKRDGDEGRGLSLISDNPVYVQGNFNLHQDAGGQKLEEFTQLLAADYGNFYDRTELDLSFADRNKDQWRPSEIVADAVTLLSDNFCDGSIEDGLINIGGNNLPRRLQGRYGCGTGIRTSYHNQNRPKTKVDNDATRRGVLWVRANLIDSYPEGVRTSALHQNLDEGESPILISRLGKPVQWNDLAGTSADYAGAYVETKDGGKNSKDGKGLITATSNRMNLIMVSGLVPSREGQSYGGLHNFPRFLENWENQDMFISGAFLQLNFSTYATAPFDQEAWQPGAPDPKTGDDANEWIRYYDPPNRRWGYDVGLQYAPAGPVAQRFQFAEDIRSEFYSEPPANDPYIRNLCLQVPGNAAAKCPT